jgi:hypothetical protein
VDRSGASSPNGVDFWWDGQGRGSCWQRPSAAGSEPLALPRCGADDLPAGAGINRAVAEPAKTLKLYVCADYSLTERRIPGNCDWFGARGLARIEVQVALAEAVLIGLAVLAVALRLLRRRPAGAIAAVLALAGLALGVVGTAYETTWWTPVGLALLGTGWLGLGWSLRSGGRRALGWLTLALGLAAVLGAVDRGLVMLPYTPVGPVWVRVLLELVWVPWVTVAAARRRRPVAAEPRPAPVPEPDELTRPVAAGGPDR